MKRRYRVHWKAVNNSTTMKTYAWIPMRDSLPTLGTVLHIQTQTSRRKATVIATKRGFALLLYQQ